MEEEFDRQLTRYVPMFWGIYIIKSLNCLYILDLYIYLHKLAITAEGETYQISKSSICILSLSFFFIWGKTKREQQLGWYGGSIYILSSFSTPTESQWFSGGHCTKCYYIPKSQPTTTNVRTIILHY